MIDSPPNSLVDVAELAGYRLWHLLCKARYFDAMSRSCELTTEEEASAWAAFCQRHKLDSASEPSIPAEYVGCTPQQLRAAIEREQRVVKWKEQEFGPLVQGYFDQHRAQMDRLVYSLLRVQDVGIARELWLRIQEGEETFASLSQTYGGGAEKFTGGVVGPVTVASMHPELAGRLRSARESELLHPFSVGDLHLVARLEKRIPAVLDSQLRSAILDELATKSMQANG
jgi:hypothetical protein